MILLVNCEDSIPSTHSADTISYRSRSVGAFTLLRKCKKEKGLLQATSARLRALEDRRLADLLGNRRLADLLGDRRLADLLGDRRLADLLGDRLFNTLAAPRAPAPST